MKKIADIWRRLREKSAILFSEALAGGFFLKGRSAAVRNVVTGLRLGGNYLEWTTFREAKTGFEILASNNAVLPDNAGEPAAAEERSEQIKLHCAELTGGVSVGLPSDKMLMRIAELPTTDPLEIKKMIQLQMDAFSPFPDDRMFVTHEILLTGEAGVRVLISAVQKDLIESTGALLAKAGLDVQRIDAEAMAWWHLLSLSAPVADEGRHLLLILEPCGGVWIAVQQRAPLAFRAVGSPEGIAPVEFANELARDASALVLALDMEHGSAPLDGLELWCRGIEGGPLADVLTAELQHEVKVQSLDQLAPLSEGLARRFAGTILTPALNRIKDRQAVLDLVPESWRSTLIAQLVRRRLIAATVGVLAVWFAALVIFFSAFQYEKYRLSGLEKRLNDLQKPAEEVRLMQNQVKSFNQYLDRKNSALECLLEISQNLPKDVLLTSFQFKKGKSVVIRGEALAVNPIYDYKQALDKSRLFGKIEMGSIQPGKRKDTSVQTFQMTGKLKEQP